VTPFIAVAALGLKFVGAVALVVADLAAVEAWTRAAALRAIARKVTSLTTMSDVSLPTFVTFILFLKEISELP
jgi:hypothetical protein